jgi:hypothetical protein
MRLGRQRGATKQAADEAQETVDAAVDQDVNRAIIARVLAAIGDLETAVRDQTRLIEGPLDREDILRHCASDRQILDALGHVLAWPSNDNAEYVLAIWLLRQMVKAYDVDL